MKKRLLSLLLALTLCLALLPGMARAEGETIQTVSNEAELSTALENESYSTVKMTANIDITDELIIDINGTVTLDLNGYVLRQTGTPKRVIRLDKGTLTLKDSSPETAHEGLPSGGVITGGNMKSTGGSYGGGVFVQVNGTFIMEGGSIYNCNAVYGGGVGVQGAFTMISGSIVNCNATTMGGGVYVNTGATFTMYDGTISGCSAMIGSDKCCYGTFIDKPKCAVTFDPDGGLLASGDESKIVRKGDKVPEPAAPSKAGYTLDGWYIGDRKWSFEEDTVTEPMTLKAKWSIKQYTVTFDPDGGSNVASITQDYNTQINAPEAPTKYGYTFAGWYDGENKQEFPFTLTGNKNLTAKWTIKQYTVTFDPDGGSDVPSITQNYNTTVDAPEAPTKYGYTFAGWYDGETKQEFPFTLTDNKTLKAKWTPIPVTPVEEPAMPWWAILPALDETQGFSFADVDRGDWFYNDVYSACEAGLMTGTGADTFSPYGGATRGMIVTVLARMSGVSTSGNPWYAAGQRWAMTNGVSDGTDMTGTITREQLAAMLYRYAQLCGADVSVGADINILRYADAAELSGYAVPAMQWACGVGLVQGSGGKLSPKATANRAQAAAMLMRFCTVVR